MTEKYVKKLVILGSTGSVGRQALDTVRAGGYRVTALAAGTDYITIEEQAREFMPEFCVLDDEAAALKLKLALKDTDIKVLSGKEGISYIIGACRADVVVNSIIGAAGLLPTIEAVRSGCRLALANKESLVMAGNIIMPLALECGCEIIPVDSEHSAIFQCLEGRAGNDIKNLILTASGGPFYGRNAGELERITPEEALAHPTWKMGKKITIDSATLMNKGFEVIEAARLFGVSYDKIKVVIHRESIIHSMVEYFDNSIIAQMSVPDMRLCVQYALNYPERKTAVIDRLDLLAAGKLTFLTPDTTAFPLLASAYDCLVAGGAMPAVLNAANEIAVSAFLGGEIGFADIARTVITTLEGFACGTGDGSVEEIMYYDSAARIFAREVVKKTVRRTQP